MVYHLVLEADRTIRESIVQFASSTETCSRETRTLSSHDDKTRFCDEDLNLQVGVHVLEGAVLAIVRQREIILVERFLTSQGQSP